MLFQDLVIIWDITLECLLVVLYGFYLHIKFGQVEEGEKDLLAFDKIFKDDMGENEELRSWRAKFVERLAKEFDKINYNNNEKFMNSSSLLDGWKAKLLGKDVLSIETLEKTFNDSSIVIEEWEETKGQEIVKHFDQKRLLDSLKYADGGEYRLVDAKTFTSYTKEITEQFSKWAENGELDKIEQYCKRYNYAIRDELEYHYERMKKKSDKDIMEQFGEELVNPENKDAMHPVMAKIYDNYVIEVYKDRTYIADTILDIITSYKKRFMNYSRKSLEYRYQYYKYREDVQGHKLKSSQMFDLGRRFYDAQLFDKSIYYMDKLYQKYASKLTDDDGVPIPITTDNKRFISEIKVRAYLSHAYYEQALKTGKYDPNDKNWKNAEFNLARLFDFIFFMNALSQEKKKESIRWQKTLFTFYYQIMYDYKELLDLKAEYMRDNPGTYTIDLEIRARRWLNPVDRKKIVGDRFVEKESKDAAFYTWQRVLWICSYLGNQSPKFSPDERNYLFIETFKIYIKLAKLDTKDDNNHYLIIGWKAFHSKLGKRSAGKYIFYNDKEFDAKWKALMQEIIEIANERDIEDVPDSLDKAPAPDDDDDDDDATEEE